MADAADGCEVVRLEVTVPGVPPSINTVWRARRVGRVCSIYKTARGYAYGSDVTWAVQAARRGKSVTSLMPGDIVRITMTWYRPDRRKRDSANVIKVLEDGIAAALAVDDRHFEWTTHRAYDREDPRVELTIEIEPAPRDRRTT